MSPAVEKFLTPPRLRVFGSVGRGGDRDIIACGTGDGAVRVWDAITGQPLGEPLIGHDGSVVAVAVGRVGNHDAIVSSGPDRTVRIWDLTERGSLVIDLLRAVTAVASTKADNSLCVITGGTICLFTE